MGSGEKADSMPLAVVMLYLLVIIMREVGSSWLIWSSYKSRQCVCVVVSTAIACGHCTHAQSPGRKLGVLELK